MAKYSSEIKYEIAKLVTEGMLSTNEASRKYGVNKSDVIKWSAAYQSHGIEGIERKRISYSGEFKQAVIEDMQKSGLSLRQAAAKYNIGTHNVVAKWERIYLEEGAQGLYVERRGRTNEEKSGRPPKLSKANEEDLIAENQRLRMENAYLKKLNALVQEREKLKRKTKLK